MYCTTCGKKLPDGALACDECGTRFTPGGDTIEEPKTEQGSEKAADAEGGHRPYMDYKPFSGANGPGGAQNGSGGANGSGYAQSGNGGEGGSYYSQSEGSASGSYNAQSSGAYDYSDPDAGSRRGWEQYEPAPPDRMGTAIGGFTVGLIALCSCCVPFFSVPLGIIGLILSILGFQSSYRGLAIAGIVLSALSLAFGILLLLLSIMDGVGFRYYWYY